MLMMMVMGDDDVNDDDGGNGGGAVFSVWLLKIQQVNPAAAWPLQGHSEITFSTITTTIAVTRM
jgi:hypothetical protein